MCLALVLCMDGDHECVLSKNTDRPLTLCSSLFACCHLFLQCVCSARSDSSTARARGERQGAEQPIQGEGLSHRLGRHVGAVVLVYRDPHFVNCGCCTVCKLESQLHRQGLAPSLQPAQQLGATTAVPPQGATATMLLQMIRPGVVHSQKPVNLIYVSW